MCTCKVVALCEDYGDSETHKYSSVNPQFTYMAQQSTLLLEANVTDHIK